jgi:hypothetical protein
MSRKTSYNTDDLIDNPSGIIESLMRDEILVERDLVIDRVSSNVVTIDGSVNSTPVNSAVNDFYNNAIIVNASKNGRYFISDYAGSTRQFTMSSTPTGWAAGDLCYIKNIRGNDFIDTDYFDTVGAGTVETGTATSTTAGKLIDSTQNFLSTVLPGMVVKNVTDTTYTYVKTVDSNTQITLMEDIVVSGEEYMIYGTRAGWKFRRSLNSKQSSKEIINQLCYESNTILVRSHKKYRLVSLEGGNTVGTLTNPDAENGIPQVFPQLTPLSSIYTDFTLNYGYDYAKKKYTKSLSVNKNASSDASLDALKTNCASAETDYKIKRKWEYNSDWIDDDSTAVYFLSLMVQKLTYQRLLIEWRGNLQYHFQYEKGDRVLLNYSTMLPVGKNNSTVFLITGKTIDFKKKVVSLYLLY